MYFFWSNFFDSFIDFERYREIGDCKGRTRVSPDERKSAAGRPRPEVAPTRARAESLPSPDEVSIIGDTYALLLVFCVCVCVVFFSSFFFVMVHRRVHKGPVDRTAIKINATSVRHACPAYALAACRFIASIELADRARGDWSIKILVFSFDFFFLPKTVIDSNYNKINDDNVVYSVAHNIVFNVDFNIVIY